MLPFTFASNYTRVPALQTNFLIANGGTIQVHGILCATSSTGVLTVSDVLGNVILSFNVGGNSSFELKTSFIAVAGLMITTPANMTCTVFHSNAGA